MWYKNQPKLEYKIRTSTTEFAFFWNENYKDLYEFTDPKNPKFKSINEISKQDYQIRFDKELDMFLDEIKAISFF